MFVREYYRAYRYEPIKLVKNVFRKTPICDLRFIGYSYMTYEQLCEETAELRKELFA